jgi:hypothetical protein
MDVDDFGHLPHHVAAFGAELPVLQWFLSQAAIPLDTKTVSRGPSVDGRTMLIWAADQGKIHTVKWLMEQGADPLQLTREGQRVSELAASQGHAAVAAVLREREEAARAALEASLAEQEAAARRARNEKRRQKQKKAKARRRQQEQQQEQEEEEQSEGEEGEEAALRAGMAGLAVDDSAAAPAVAAAAAAAAAAAVTGRYKVASKLGIVSRL